MDLSGEKQRNLIIKQTKINRDITYTLSIRSFTQNSTVIVQSETVDTSLVTGSEKTSHDGLIFEDS